MKVTDDVYRFPMKGLYKVATRSLRPPTATKLASDFNVGHDASDTADVNDPPFDIFAEDATADDPEPIAPQLLGESDCWVPGGEDSKHIRGSRTTTSTREVAAGQPTFTGTV